MNRLYPLLPTLPDSGLLSRYLDTFGVIVPLARTNLCTNPSFETNTTGWTNAGGTLSAIRDTTVQYHGAYSLFIIHDNTANSGVYFSVNLTSGTLYAFSLKHFDLNGPSLASLSVPGNNYKLSIATSGGVDLAARRFQSGIGWSWPTLLWLETSTTTRRLYIVRTDAQAGAFNIDGVQIESCADGYNTPTTYLDGDQLGLVPNQFPAAYGWNGAPHASSSYRIGQTRAGGRIVRLKDLGFLLTTIIGLGLAPPAHQALTFAQLDGGQYENTLKPPRQFSLAGRVAAATPNSADSGIGQLSRILDRDLIAQRQPLVLTAQAQECGVDCGERVTIPALYSGGLEGQALETPTQQLPISFAQYIPFVAGRDAGAALTVQQNVTNANGVVQRSQAGQWRALGTGVGAAEIVQAFALGNDGSLFVGGDFADLDGVANTRAIGRWNGSAFNAMGTGAAAAGIIAQTGLAIGPDGSLYAGGLYTLMGGVANTVNIAKWNGSAWSALGTGTNGLVRTVTVGPDGSVYIGGDFTLAGGVANTVRVAKWDGSVWTPLSTGANGSVYQLMFGKDGYLYAVGTFTTIGGVAANNVARWNGTAWAALGSGTASGVSSIAIGSDGTVYVGGAFTTIGGVAANYVASWNGVGYAPLGNGANSQINSLSMGPDGFLYANAQFTIASGFTVSDPIAKWNGSLWLAVDINLPATPSAIYIAALRDGTLNLGYATTGTAVAAGITTATNNGTVAMYPTLTIRGPSSGTSRIYQFLNITTGASIFCNYVMTAGETAVLTLDPKNVSFVSSSRGNILNTIMPGSNMTNFVLQPGANTISFYADSSTVEAPIQWQIGYGNLNDALYQAIAP